MIINLYSVSIPKANLSEISFSSDNLYNVIKDQFNVSGKSKSFPRHMCEISLPRKLFISIENISFTYLLQVEIRVAQKEFLLILAYGMHLDIQPFKIVCKQY